MISGRRRYIASVIIYPTFLSSAVWASVHTQLQHRHFCYSSLPSTRLVVYSSYDLPNFLETFRLLICSLHYRFDNPRATDQSKTSEILCLPLRQACNGTTRQSLSLRVELWTCRQHHSPKQNLLATATHAMRGWPIRDSTHLYNPTTRQTFSAPTLHC